MLTKKDIDYLLEVCSKAGKEILKFFGDSRASYKDNNTPVTEADLASNEVITNALEKFGLPIISEETRSSHKGVNADRYWLVDPLDGTKEFISGSDEFTVNIALVENRKPIFGIVSAPAKGECWVGINYGKKKSFKIDSEGNFRLIYCRKPQEKALESLVSKSHSDKIKLEEFYRKNKLHIVKEIPAGSSLKICYIAEGKADIYPRLGPTMEWDIAAAQAVLEAADGYLLIEKAHELFYGKDGLKNPHFIATNFKYNFRF